MQEANTLGCPPWCRVKHQTGARFHARCAGELHWADGSVVVVVTQRSADEGVELAYHAAGEPPAVAFLSRDDARRLHACLGDALGVLDAA